METDRKKQLDPQFLLLSALGMIFVVDGHINSNYLDLGGFFPYYSFHVPLLFQYILEKISRFTRSLRRRRYPAS